MTPSPPATIAFLGLGLIGGSIAKALTANSSSPPGLDVSDRPNLTAWTPDGRGPARAASEGMISFAASSPAEAIRGADLVVIAAPPVEAIALVRRLGSDLAPYLSSSALVTDVTSTKGAIVAAAREAGIRFVGGHPMAGRETSGYAASSADLFVDRPWVIVGADGTTVAMADPVRWLAARCGARIVEMSAANHDAATAAVSHLPLVAAAALVEAVCGAGSNVWAIASALAASGWAGATRLALGDPRMGAGIVATNAPEVAANVRALRDAFDSWLAVLEDPGGADVDTLERRFAAAREALAPSLDLER